MNGWFTTWTFWAGATWGASTTFLVLWYWLIKPMGELLGFDRPAGEQSLGDDTVVSSGGEA